MINWPLTYTSGFGWLYLTQVLGFQYDMASYVLIVTIVSVHAYFDVRRWWQRRRQRVL